MTFGNEGTEPLATTEPAVLANPPAEEVEDLEANPEGEPEGGEPEDYELDWEDGQKYRVPAALKNGFLRHKDYTQKTQKLSSDRTALTAEIEAERTSLQSRRKEIGQLVAMENNKSAVEAELAEYGKVDWAALRQQDPDQYQVHRDRVSDLRAAQQELGAAIDKAQKGETEAAQQATAKRMQAIVADAQANIPGWNEQMDAEITAHAMQRYGMEREELRALANPKTYRMLHRLWALETAAARQPKPQPAPREEPIAQPLAPVARGRAVANPGPSDRQPISDWMKSRERQVAGRRR